MELMTRIRFALPCCAVALAVCLSGLNVIAAETLQLLPGDINLHGPQATQRLLPLWHDGSKFITTILTKPVWTSSNPEVVTVTNGRLTPIGNGSADVTVSTRDGKHSATTRVTVTAMDQNVAWEFRRHVLPVLAKQGCNSGACHGALAGKGGFKLSLRGYDAFRDHFVITREARGRRIETGDPGRSLLVAKPTGAIAHKGGLRFNTDSAEYKILSEWIADGAAPPTKDDATLDRLEVLPGTITLAVGDTQPLLIRAFYSDGRTEDVTQWAKYSSTNEAVCQVSEAGEVTIVGPGEGAITAWFSSQIVICRITVPFPHAIPADVYKQAKTRNFIDKLVLSQLQRLNLKPSPAADDAAFLRRAHLDTLGVLPTVAEVRTFLEDKSPDKRDKLIEALLARPEFVDYWTYKWADVLLLNGTKLRPEALKAYNTWIRGHVEKNTPWDVFVREIVTSQGSSFKNGATNFYALHQTPEDMTENVSQAFLGLSIGCAKCHNHPLEKWTNDQYYGMANMFARVRTKGWGGDSRNGDGLRTLYVAPTGDLIQPLTGKPQPPTPLDGEPLDFDDANDRRIPLANWLTSPENPYFARAVANRVWANFLGVGLVEQVDDLRVSNPASNEELLSALAAHVVEHDFDLKSLMRTILQSETYQRSSQPLPENAAEQRFYSRYYPKRLMAEVLLDAITKVTAVPSVFNEIEFPGADRKKTDEYPKGTRALELHDSAVRSYFLQTFGRNPRDITCECERSNVPSMVQVLHLSNGETINKKLQAEDSRVAALMKDADKPAAIIEEIYLAGLSRYPTKRETARLLKLVKDAPEAQRRAVIEDLFWAVLTSKEFLFNH